MEYWMKALSEDRIRVKAYELWEQSGRPQGLELEHWLLAERTLVEREPDAGGASAVAAAPAKRKTTRARKPVARSRRRGTTN
jgi:hypothetical protein